MSETVITSFDNGVYTIKFNRPDKYNAFNREMAIAVQHALDYAMKREEIRAVFITADGKAFCSGQDLKEASDPANLDLRKIVHGHYNPIIDRIRHIEKPVVIAVNGVAAGAGANIALAGDIVVAKESASFVQAFSKIGLIPDCGGTYFLPRMIGWGKASALMMLADDINAKDAAEMGMIYKTFPDDTFEEESYAIAQKLATMPTVALAYTKLALNESVTNNLTQQLSVEEDYQGRCGDTEDFAEGITSFVEKRKPIFLGK